MSVSTSRRWDWNLTFLTSMMLYLPRADQSLGMEAVFSKLHVSGLEDCRSKTDGARFVSDFQTPQDVSACM